MKRTQGAIKFCPKCKKDSEFGTHKNRADGLCSWCKSCMKFYYTKNREKLLEQKHQHYLNNIEMYSERNRTRIENNPKKILVSRAKRRAKLRNVPFSLTIEDIIIPKICPVLNIPIQINKDISKYDSISLDRIIPELGYVKDNIIVISLKANQIKNCANMEELELVYKFYKNLFESRL